MTAHVAQINKVLGDARRASEGAHPLEGEGAGGHDHLKAE